MVVFAQKCLYSEKVDVIGESGCIRAKVYVFGQSGGILAKLVVFGQSACIRSIVV